MIRQRARGLFVALLATACGGGGLGPVPGTCNKTSDCANDSVCVVGTCVPGATSFPGLHLELTPPASSQYVRTQILDVDASRSPLDLTLPEPISLRVKVFDDRGGGGSQPITATLNILADDGIPGRREVLRTRLIARDPRTEILRLNPGEYNASLTPIRGGPALESRFTVRAGSGADITKEFHFGTPRRISGLVTSSVERGTKVPGVRVSAVAMSNGLASTSSITGPNGAFRIDLPESDETSFILMAEPDETQQPAWGYEEVVIVPRDGDRQKDIELEPTAETSKVTARIQIGGKSSEGFIPLGNVNVTLTATRAASTRVFRALGTTDADGYVAVRGGPTGRGPLRLLQARYRVEVTPPAESQFQGTTELVDFTSTPRPDEQISLLLRKRYVGSVRSSAGPTAFASVELRPLLVGGTPAFTVTDLNGDFELWVDPGAYILIIDPLPTGNIGPPLAMLLDDVTISEDSDPRPATFELTHGAPLSGVVRGSVELAPAADTEVEVLVEKQGRTVSVGRTTSDAEGSFSILLPRL